MDSKLLEVLVCPVSKGPLHFNKESNELWCHLSRLAYPVEDDIPVMLEEQARPLTQEEVDSLR